VNGEDLVIHVSHGPDERHFPGMFNLIFNVSSTIISPLVLRELLDSSRIRCLFSSQFRRDTQNECMDSARPIWILEMASTKNG
jgi:hypothetical protein